MGRDTLIAVDTGGHSPPVYVKAPVRRIMTNKEVRDMYKRLGLKTLPILERE